MGRREWLWGAGTAVVLLTGAWVSSAGPIAPLTTPGLSRPNEKEFGEVVLPDRGDNRSGGKRDQSSVLDAELVANVVTWTIKILIALVVLLLLALAARALLRLLRGEPVTTKEDVAAPVLPDVLIAGVRESEALLDGGTSSDAIINAWLGLERTAAAVGLDDDASRTPGELVAAVLDQYSVDPASIRTLADLYREARFSRHELGETEREAARTALAQVHDDLTRPLAALWATT